MKSKKMLVVFLTSIIVLAGLVSLGFVLFKTLFNSEPENFGEIYYSAVDAKHIKFDKDGTNYADNEILITVNDNISKNEVEKLSDKYNATIVGRIEKSGDYQLKIGSNISADELKKTINKIKKEKIIYSASLNYIQVFSDNEKVEGRDGFYYGKEWQNDLQNYNDAKGKSWGLEAIGTLGAWDLLNSNRSKVNPVKVGVIDGGFDSSHEDLSFADLFYEDNNNASGSTDIESKDHGTHVTGIIAANNSNNTGICGVYPYSEGNIFAVNHSANGIGAHSENKNFLSSIMGQKISYAELIVRNVKVINQSQAFNWYLNLKDVRKRILGNKDLEYTDYNKVKDFFETNDFLSYEEEANLLGDFLNRLLKKGYDFVIVNAAGNDSDSSIGHLESKYSSWNNMISREKYPEVYNRIIVVGAVDSKYNITDFSNTGSRVDIFAPGKDIFSTRSKAIFGHKYGKLSGTSQAAPHVAGVAAMVWSANNDLSGSDVKSIICKYNNLRCTSCKMVDAYSSVENAIKRNKNTTTKTSNNNGILMSFVVDQKKENNYISDAKLVARPTNANIVYTAKTDSEGHFELVLPEGNYNLSISASNYKNKTINNIIIKNNEVNNLDWIKLKYDDTNNKALNNKISELIEKYGVASTETYERKNLDFADYGWANRSGVLSANLLDLDGDSINELITVRCSKKIKQDSVGRSYADLIIEVFFSEKGQVKSAGQYKLENTNDCETAQVNIFTYKINNKQYVCYERDFRGLLVDYDRPEYFIFEYSNNTLNKVMRLYQAFMGTSGTDLTQITWKNGKENKISIQTSYYDYKNNKETHIFKGKYKNSEYPFDKAMIDFGFKKSIKGLFGESRKESRYLSYVYQKSADKICSISTRPFGDTYDATNSSAIDYTGLDHSNPISEPQKIPKWKELYLDYLKTDDADIYNYAELVYINDDNIPELVLQSGSTMPGGFLCWVDKDEVKTYDLGASQGINYTAKKGILYSGIMREGNQFFSIFSFNGKEVKEEHSGSIIPNWDNENKTVYTLDNKKMSKSQQDKILSKYKFKSYVPMEHSLYDIKSEIKKK